MTKVSKAAKQSHCETASWAEETFELLSSNNKNNKNNKSVHCSSWGVVF